MITAQFLDSIRELHKDCCLCHNCRDRGCEINLDGIDTASLTIINGSAYQKAHSGTDAKLADCVVFANMSNRFVAVIELKGGDSIRMGDAIEQIQMGMSLAEEFLNGREIDSWYPLLIFSGEMGLRELRQLQRRRIEFRGERKSAIRRECGSNLREIIVSINQLESD